MATPSLPPSPLIFIFDSVRLRSHLFFRYLSTSPQVQPIYHPYLCAAMFGPERIGKHFKTAVTSKEVHENKPDPMYGSFTMADATEQFTQALAKVETGGKVAISNEHWFNVVRADIMLDILRGNITDPAALGPNPTHIPSQQFNTLQPIILIRHPIPSIDSTYRTELAIGNQNSRLGTIDLEMLTQNQPLRLLFNYFRTEKNVQPIVVDGDDVLWRTPELSEKLCALLGLGELKETWTPTLKEEVDKIHPLVYSFTKDVHDSSGIQRPMGKSGRIPELDDAVKDWTVKYGGHVAGHLRQHVEENMPHYEYLAQFKL